MLKGVLNLCIRGGVNAHKLLRPFSAPYNTSPLKYPTHAPTILPSRNNKPSLITRLHSPPSSHKGKKGREEFEYEYDQKNSLPTFEGMGLLPGFTDVLESMDIHTPTPIQQHSIPNYLRKREGMFIGSPNGTGKTLAYLIPVINELRRVELNLGEQLTAPQRPRALVLLPTRELVQQLISIAHQFVYEFPLRIGGLYSGQKWAIERRDLLTGLDLIFSTPDRLLSHSGTKAGGVYLGKLEHLVIDEIDTLMESGYKIYIQELFENLKGVEAKRAKDNKGYKGTGACKGRDSLAVGNDGPRIIPPKNIKVTCCSATLMGSTERLLNKHFPKMEYVVDKSMHQNLSHLTHTFIHLQEYDKFKPLHQFMSKLLQSLKTHKSSVIIFCNTVQSTRATEYSLASMGLKTSCIHGEIPPRLRKQNYQDFQHRRSHVLIATDVASRGLDFPFVTHVLNFDFCRSSMDYLQRAGRAGRGGQPGSVVSFYRNSDKLLINELENSYRTRTPLNLSNSALTSYDKSKNINKNSQNSVSPGASERRMARSLEGGNTQLSAYRSQLGFWNSSLVKYLGGKPPVKEERTLRFRYKRKLTATMREKRLMKRMAVRRKKTLGMQKYTAIFYSARRSRRRRK